jgi:hypothetical protein
MNDVSDDSKVEKMAIHLNISQATLASLKKEFRVDTPLLATKMLMAWRSNLTCDRVEDAKQQLTAALRSVGLARKAKLVTLGNSIYNPVILKGLHDHAITFIIIQLYRERHVQKPMDQHCKFRVHHTDIIFSLDYQISERGALQEPVAGSPATQH